MILAVINMNINNLTVCHKKYYVFPNNEFLIWNNWNCLYDFIHDQYNIYGRTQLFTNIYLFQLHIKIQTKDNKIKFFARKTTRDRYIKRNIRND